MNSISKLLLTLRKVIEILGLDWLVMLLGKPAFDDAPPPNAVTLSEARAKFSKLKNEKLQDALGHCTALVKREEERADKIESKAFNLIGITGIASGFITGFATLLLDSNKIDSLIVLLVVAILYFLLAFSLVWTPLHLNNYMESATAI